MKEYEIYLCISVGFIIDLPPRKFGALSATPDQTSLERNTLRHKHRTRCGRTSSITNVPRSWMIHRLLPTARNSTTHFTRPLKPQFCFYIYHSPTLEPLLNLQSPTHSTNDNDPRSQLWDPLSLNLYFDLILQFTLPYTRLPHTTTTTHPYPAPSKSSIVPELSTSGSPLDATTSLHWLCTSSSSSSLW